MLVLLRELNTRPWNINDTYENNSTLTKQEVYVQAEVQRFVVIVANNFPSWKLPPALVLTHTQRAYPSFFLHQHQFCLFRWG